MILHCSTATGWTLHEADNFCGFKVVLDGVAAGAAPAVEGLVFAGDHAWVHPDLPALLAGSAANDDWRAEFDRMVAFAAKHGWVREDGAVRAHVETAG